MRQHTHWLSSILCLLCTFVPLSAQSNSPVSILNNQEIWSSHFLSALPYLTHWADLGETEIMLQANVVKGMRVLRTRNEGEARMLSAQTAQRDNTPRWMRPQIINAYPAIGFQLASHEAPGAFLREGLTVRHLIKQLGEPEQTRNRLITTDDREVKPISLNEYVYANGSITFAAFSDAADPDQIEVVFLDLPTLAPLLNNARVK